MRVNFPFISMLTQTFSPESIISAAKSTGNDGAIEKHDKEKQKTKHNQKPQHSNFCFVC